MLGSDLLHGDYSMFHDDLGGIEDIEVANSLMYSDVLTLRTEEPMQVGQYERQQHKIWILW